MDGFLIVDDRDGRVVMALDDVQEALEMLDNLEQDEPELAAALCLVKFNRADGALLGTETSWRVRTLS